MRLEILFQFRKQDIDMKFSISAVSGNRKFTKALVQNASEIDVLRNAAIRYDTGSLSFDTLQLVFLDRDQSYFRVVGCKRDRIFQVEVATPDDGQKAGYSSPESLVRAIADRLILALNSTNLPDEDKKKITLDIHAAIL